MTYFLIENKTSTQELLEKCEKNVSAPCLLFSLSKLDEVPTATEHASYKVQSNLHAHKYNMPSTRIPYQISRGRPEPRMGGVFGIQC